MFKHKQMQQWKGSESITLPCLCKIRFFTAVEMKKIQMENGDISVSTPSTDHGCQLEPTISWGSSNEQPHSTAE